MATLLIPINSNIIYKIGLTSLSPDQSKPELNFLKDDNNISSKIQTNPTFNSPTDQQKAVINSSNNEPEQFILTNHSSYPIQIEYISTWLRDSNISSQQHYDDFINKTFHYLEESDNFFERLSTKKMPDLYEYTPFTDSYNDLNCLENIPSNKLFEKPSKFFFS